MSEEVLFYLGQLRRGIYREDAYHALIELDSSYLPEFISLFHQEKNPIIKALLLEVICKHKMLETLFFLQETLHSNDAHVWKTALDGIVAFNYPQSIEILVNEKARLQTCSDKGATERLEWIEEAYQQLQENLQNIQE